MGQEQPLSRRQQLHLILAGILGNNNEVHYQPPNGTQMNYTSGAIVYNLDAAETEFADNLPYRRTKRYQVTVIHTDPDLGEALSDKVANLPACTMTRWFATENLNHYVFDLYF